MGYVIKSKQDNILKDDALAISRVANLDKGGINATVGAFQPFNVFSFVQEIESNLSTKEKYSYSSVDGGENFRRAVNSYLGLEGHYVVSTPGGTGAITCSVSLTLERGESLLTPYPCWGPYFGIAKGNGLKSVTYNLIKNDHFDLEDFTNKANEIIKNEHKLVFILNDPCQNPTGYSLRDDEINALFSFLNKQSVPVSVILDIAYIDMSYEERHKTRKFLNVKLNSNVQILYCVSFSKSYQIYGQRLGALACLDEHFYKVACFHARTTWSNCNHGMISLVEKVELNEETKQKHREALSNIQRELKERSELFLKEAKECGLKTLKYSGGFFISVPCKNNSEVYEKLKEEHIHLLPVCDIIRVAICGLKMDEIKGLAQKIKKHVD